MSTMCEWKSEEEKQTLATALVVYVEPKPSTMLFQPLLGRLGSGTVLTSLIDRSASAWGHSVGEYIVLSHAGGPPTCRAEDATRVAVRYIEVVADGILSALTRMFERHSLVTTALLLPEGSIFPDCQRAGELLRNHHNTTADLTFSPNTPVGFLPLAVTPDGVHRLHNVLPRPRSCVDLFNMLVELAKRSGDGLPTWIQLFQPSEPNNGILERLPEQVLVTNVNSLHAAERVLAAAADPVPTDHSLSVALKAELLRRSEVIVRVSGLRPDDFRYVLFSSLQPAFSGGEESLYQLIANLTPNKYQPVAWFPMQTTLSRKLTDRNIPVEIGDRNRHALTGDNLRYYEHLLDVVRPSVIHVDGFVNPALMVVGRLRHIPIVSHVRMILPLHLQTELALADSIIAISDTVATALKRRNISPTIVRTIYNGVDMARFSPSQELRDSVRRALGLASTDLVISLVGRITPKKQHHMLVDALSVLRRKMDNIHVLMAGDIYDQQYFHQLCETAAKSGVDDRIHWIGFCPRIEEIYAASDVMALCTRFEPFGRCIIEALAMGLPCVVPDSGGPAEIVRHGVNGLLFSTRDPEELVSALWTALSDEEFRAELGRSARTSATEYETRNHVMRIEAVYDELLAGRC